MADENRIVKFGHDGSIEWTKNTTNLRLNLSETHLANVVTIFGPTKVGKSLLVRTLKEALANDAHHEVGGHDLPRTAEAGEIRPTTAGIKPFVVDHEEGRFILVDTEGLFAAEFAVPMETLSDDIEALPGRVSMKQHNASVLRHTPRLAYLTSQVLIYMVSEAPGSNKWLPEVREFGEAAIKCVNHPQPPSLVLVFNQQPNSETTCMSDIDGLSASVRAAHDPDGNLEKLFANIRCVALPTFTIEGGARGKDKFSQSVQLLQHELHRLLDVHRRDQVLTPLSESSWLKCYELLVQSAASDPKKVWKSISLALVHEMLGLPTVTKSCMTFFDETRAKFWAFAEKRIQEAIQRNEWTFPPNSQNDRALALEITSRVEQCATKACATAALYCFLRLLNKTNFSGSRADAVAEVIAVFDGCMPCQSYNHETTAYMSCSRILRDHIGKPHKAVFAKKNLSKQDKRLAKQGFAAFNLFNAKFKWEGSFDYGPDDTSMPSRFLDKNYYASLGKELPSVIGPDEALEILEKCTGDAAVGMNSILAEKGITHASGQSQEMMISLFSSFVKDSRHVLEACAKKCFS